IICFQASIGYSQVLWFGPAMPALATRISIVPKRAIVDAVAAATLEASETLATSFETGPAVLSCVSAWESSSASRSHNETAAPQAKRRLAIARPMPCAAPVTIAYRCSRSIRFMFAHLHGFSLGWRATEKEYIHTDLLCAYSRGARHAESRSVRNLSQPARQGRSGHGRSKRNWRSNRDGIRSAGRKSVLLRHRGRSRRSRDHAIVIAADSPCLLLVRPDRYCRRAAYGPKRRGPFRDSRRARQ